VHDHGRGFLSLFSNGLHHLSRERRRKIVGIHRLDCRLLLPDTRFARSACLCDVASRDFDACSGFSSPMGPAQVDRALDHPNLAVCLGHRRACVFDALQMVSSGTVTVALWATPHVSANVSVVLPTGKRLQMHHAKSCARQLFDV